MSTAKWDLRAFIYGCDDLDDEEKKLCYDALDREAFSAANKREAFFALDDADIISLGLPLLSTRKALLLAGKHRRGDWPGQGERDRSRPRQPADSTLITNSGAAAVAPSPRLKDRFISPVICFRIMMSVVGAVADYLLGVQKSNHAEVNEAINGLLIEEEDFEGLKHSISTYDNFDQLGLATKLEKHELIEFRRLVAMLYKQNQKWRRAVELAQADGLFRDAMETTAQSGEAELAEELLR
ncbi:hypothetical protein HYH03_017487 [Edaphochlamys debaryana]|uniref:Uncharacterized protein n=1 Tax=Edaphochlamys debaryana TaxID=47281 RepID=A0A836BQE3_9CHLO|nr:hypothetical protein HYH03_017487 [Edaphochlamys debaryana]|eukprot:KAG2483684.1 hypothetical protein HYH03_017487 [Edaphochlamys debaryana]